MPVVKAKEAVSIIINAQRKNLEEISIPRHLIPTMKVVRLLPNKAGKVLKNLTFLFNLKIYSFLAILLKDFFEAFVESDM